MQTEINIESATDRRIEQIKADAERCLKAINWLVAEGFKPLEIVVQQERRAPTVSIALSPRCAWLKKEFIAYKHQITATHTTWRAHIMGVRVQWVERGN